MAFHRSGVADRRLRDKAEKASGWFVHSSNPGVPYFIVDLSQYSARTKADQRISAEAAENSGPAQS
jgi:hypothetical protein